MNFIEKVGKNVIFFLEHTGKVFILLLKAVAYFPKLWDNRRLVIDQMMEIGVRSVPLVLFVGLFSGAVASVQTAYQLKGFVSMNYLGAATSVAIFIELGPVLTALIIAGRVGASIAAEIGTMMVT